MRFQLTALATLVVAVVLTISAVGLVGLQRSQLTANLDASLDQRADALIASLADSGEIGVIANSNEEDRAAQLVAPDGTVLAATPNLIDEPPLPNGLDTDRSQMFRTYRDLPLEDDTYRVLSRVVGDGPNEGAVLHLAQNSDDLNETVRGLAVALATAVPIVVAALGALIWWLVGRALQPVEAIRSEVAVITGTDLERRVPVPPRDDEIARLATTMNDMLDRLAASAERQRRFVADASHELRTPITRIRTEVEVDINQPEHADPPATNRLVLDETETLQRLIDDLLHLARSDDNAKQHQPRPVDFDDIVLQEVRRRRPTARVAIDANGVSGAHMQGDPDQLTRLVRNLLDNAIRHADREVILTLGEAASTNTITFTVADDGPGVPIDNRERIFERFARVDDARTRNDGGTGLGLAIVRDIAERHDGTVRYDETSTTGARFVVVVPSAQ